MSPQDAMMHLKNMHNGANAGGVGGDPYKADGSPFPKGKKKLNALHDFTIGQNSLFIQKYLEFQILKKMWFLWKIGF